MAHSFCTTTTSRSQPTSSAVGLALVLLGCLSLVGCQKGPKVSKVGESATVGGITLDVKNYEVRRLEVVEGDRTYEYDEPVLAFEIAITNEGKKSFMYSPTHGTKQMTEASSPLLYSAPGKNKPLPPSSKSPIKGVYLEKGHPKNQVTQPTSLKPGETLHDVMLFEVPEAEKADLILSLPPSMHRGNRPVLFRVSYAYESPKGYEVHSVGDAATIDDVSFTVTSAEHAWIETKHPDEGKGFSAEPLFRVQYEITNESDEPIAYTPGHTAVSGQRTEALYADDRAISRVTFKSSDKIPGWVTSQKTVEPSKTIEDMALFESPGEGIESVRFEYPASRFERPGLIRVDIPYDHQMPDTPKELRKDEEDDEDE
jgi:hypothetical protein